MRIWLQKLDVTDATIDPAGDVIDAIIVAGEEAGEAVGDLGETAGALVTDIVEAVINEPSGIFDILTDLAESVGGALESVSCI